MVVKILFNSRGFIIDKLLSRTTRCSSNLAKKHFERRLMNYSCDELYSVVSNVSEYHQFVPWCKESRVIRTDRNGLQAELCVGFGVLNEKYTSQVSLIHPTSIIATSQQTNLFEFLKTEWKFAPSNDPSKSWVTFHVDFQFRSALYSGVCELFMQEVVNKMVHAFEQRCYSLYSLKKRNNRQTLQ